MTKPARPTGEEGVRPALWVIGAGVTAALHVGKLSPALPVLSRELGVTLVEAGFLLSLVQLAGLVLGLVVGLTADTLGLKRSMVSGLLVLSTASLLGAWTDTVPVLLALRALEGLGLLLVAMPAPGLIRQLVPPSKMSSTLGLWGAYMPLGTALALLLGPFLIGLTSWRLWWGALAVLSLAMAQRVWQVVPSDQKRAGEASSAHRSSAGWPGRLRVTLSSAGPWLVALSFAVYSGQWLAVIGFLPTIYEQAGYVGGMTAVLTATVAAANMGGNIVSGRLIERGLRPATLLYVGFCTMAVGTLLAFGTWPLSPLGQALPSSLRFVAVLMFSMVGGMIPSTLFSLSVRLAPTEATVSTTVGWMQQWAAFGQFAGPPVVGWIASKAGGWQLTWVFTAGCSAMGVLLATRLSRRSSI